MTGIDVSQSAISLAKSLHSSQSDGLHFACVNVDEVGLPFADESVDVLISITAVHWMNTRKLMQEAQRVLKKGGIIALTR